MGKIERLLILLFAVILSLAVIRCAFGLMNQELAEKEEIVIESEVSGDVDKQEEI